jgi:regulator of protease activity HflC (stomatin/prohibitin superfamily)
MLMALVVFLFCGFLAYKSLIQIPPGHRGIVERSGHTHQTLKPGTHFVMPFLDRVRVKKDPDDKT